MLRTQEKKKPKDNKKKHNFKIPVVCVFVLGVASTKIFIIAVFDRWLEYFIITGICIVSFIRKLMFLAKTHRLLHLKYELYCY